MSAKERYNRAIVTMKGLKGLIRSIRKETRLLGHWLEVIEREKGPSSATRLAVEMARACLDSAKGDLLTAECDALDVICDEDLDVDERQTLIEEEWEDVAEREAEAEAEAEAEVGRALPRIFEETLARWGLNVVVHTVEEEVHDDIPVD